MSIEHLSFAIAIQGRGDNNCVSTKDFLKFGINSGKNRFIDKFIWTRKIMSDILAQPEKFKTELKEKWLNYYQANRSWLKRYMDEDNGWSDSIDYDEEELESLELDEDYYPRRPECYFILGVVSVLEPSIHGLLSFIGDFSTESKKLVKALGLDFDPELELKKRPQETTHQQLNLDS